MNKTRSAKIVGVMLMVALAASLITYQVTIRASFQGSQESLPFYIGAPQPYSYVIDTNGTHCFAFNGTTGFLEMTSTNASAVFNNAIGNMTNGGKLGVKAGTYLLDPYYAVAISGGTDLVCINVSQNNIWIQGEGIGNTILRLKDSRYGTIIRGGLTTPVTAPNSFALENVSISDLSLDGNLANNAYQGVWNAQNNLWFGQARNVHVWNVYSYSSAAEALHFDSCSQVYAYDCILTNNQWDGIHVGSVSSSDSTVISIDIHFSDMFISNSLGYLPTTSNGGGSAIDVNNAYGIWVERIRVNNTATKGLYFDACQDLHVIDNEIWYTGQQNATNAASIEVANCNGTTVALNVIRSSGGTGISISTGTATLKPSNTQVTDNTILDTPNTYTGISIYYQQGAKVTNNIINSTTTTTNNMGIYAQYSNYTEIVGNLIYGQKYAIRVKSCAYARVVDNTGLGTSGNSLYDSDADSPSIYLALNNFATVDVGHMTTRIWDVSNLINFKPCQNSSSIVNATATTWTITHGLPSTPTGVWASFNSTQVDSWSWASTSTVITITCTNSGTTDAVVTCYWCAVYKP